MRSLLDIPAPAKINLFLHITGRRADGYHLMQSVFVLLDLCDTLHIETRADGRISRADIGSSTQGSDPLPDNDLCVRAARLLQATTGCTQGAHIQLEKRIPTQAGLGGGSSDAASTLLALNKLWRTRLSRQELTAIGLQLGADVPFFLLGDNAWVEGIGEQLTAIDYPPTPFMLLKPPVGLSTIQIFKDPNLKRDTKPATIADFLAAPKRFGQNDLQDAAVAYQASSASGNEIGQALEVMQNQFGNSRMTGSGSTVFSWVPPEQASHLPHIQPGNLGLNDALWIGRACRGLPQHPLLKMLDQIAD